MIRCHDRLKGTPEDSIFAEVLDNTCASQVRINRLIQTAEIDAAAVAFEPFYEVFKRTDTGCIQKWNRPQAQNDILHPIQLLHCQIECAHCAEKQRPNDI